MKTIDGDTAQKIANDVALDTPVQKSQVLYGPDELAFRQRITDRYKKQLEEHSKTMMHCFE